MAFFGITVERIKTSEKHPNADKLSVCTLENLPFTFVTALNQFKVGEEVIYFPIDSLIPLELANKLGVAGKLAGSNKDRVKTCKLRQVISQGIVGPVQILIPFMDELHGGMDWAYAKNPWPDGEEIAECLGVTKYEPPAVLEKGANLKCLPAGLSMYDIEGIERHQDAYAVLKDLPVYISEKVEGSNFSVTWDGTKFFVNQRRFTIEPLEGHNHTWWKIAEEQGLMAFVKKLAETYPAPVTAYGEMIGPGIQANIYKLATHQVRVFDLKTRDGFIDSKDFLKLTAENNILTAPNLGVYNNLEEFLQGKDIIAASNGKSALNPVTLREGIVIKPMEERIFNERFGRLILKQRDPIYLAGNEN